MKRHAFIFLLLFTFLCPSFVLAGEYSDNMKTDFSRGIKNIISGWMELPLTMKEYATAEEQRWPVGIREGVSLFDGLYRTLSRTTSGLWDLFAAFVPGDQAGLPVEPETLF